MKVRWEYALGLADQQRFAEVWRRHIGKTPAFEPAG